MFAGLRAAYGRWPGLRRRRLGRRGDAGSMPMALLVTLTGVSLSAGLSTMVVSGIKTTEFVADRVAAVQAAQAGLDVALGRIRSSFDALGGDRKKLPCGLLSGVFDPGGPADPITYEVSLDYFMVDPSGLQDVLGSILPSKVACLVNGLGTALVPKYALLQAKGTGPKGTVSRTLYATYTFNSPVESIPGDKIPVSASTLCLGAGTKSPKVGDPVLAVECSSDSLQTKFQYPKNLNLVFESVPKSAALPRGLCADATSQATNVEIKFQACALPTSSRQQWLFDANAFSYYGTSNGLTRSGYCFNLKNPGVAGSAIVLKNNNCGSPFVNSRNFLPGVDIGPGAAGINTGQLVNRAEVGRCLDLSNEDVTGQKFINGGKPPALITYPCKQAFDAVVPWNHRWYLPALPTGTSTVTGQISTIPLGSIKTGIPYCMKTPGPGGGRIWVAACSIGELALTWTIYGQAVLTSDAYQIKDRYGNCVQAVGAKAAPEFKMDSWSEVITAPCDGGDLQKWNVPASFSGAPLKGLGEK